MDMTQLIKIVPGLIVAITVHEYAHGLVAYRLGDPTAARAGRLTLNPLAHLDPIGVLMLWFFRFGWAKPVPVNPAYFRDPRRDMLKVSAAGPGANFIFALLFSVLEVVAYRLGASRTVIEILQLTVLYNIFLGLFNLIPIPPLDGSRIMRSLLPARSALWLNQIDAYGWLILLLLIYSGFVQVILGPVAGFVFGVLRLVAVTLVGQ